MFDVVDMPDIYSQAESPHVVSPEDNQAVTDFAEGIPLLLVQSNRPQSMEKLAQSTEEVCCRIQMIEQPLSALMVLAGCKCSTGGTLSMEVCTRSASEPPFLPLPFQLSPPAPKKPHLPTLPT